MDDFMDTYKPDGAASNIQNGANNIQNGASNFQNGAQSGASAACNQQVEEEFINAEQEVEVEAMPFLPDGSEAIVMRAPGKTP